MDSRTYLARSITICCMLFPHHELLLGIRLSPNNPGTLVPLLGCTDSVPTSMYYLKGWRNGFSISNNHVHRTSLSPFDISGRKLMSCRQIRFSGCSLSDFLGGIRRLVFEENSSACFKTGWSSDRPRFFRSMESAIGRCHQKEGSGFDLDSFSFRRCHFSEILAFVRTFSAISSGPCINAR